jgi:hypothetical protein
LPKEWTADQIRSFQDYFDAVMSGNRARRRQTRFMPANYKLIEGRQPAAQRSGRRAGRAYLLRLLVPVSPFVTTQSIRSDPSVSGSQNKKRTFS